jgi:WD40 repeat protein/predicted Ser/Thr protein kinase
MTRTGAIDANAMTLDNSGELSPTTELGSPWGGTGQARRIDAELFDPLEARRLRTRVHGSLFEAREPERIGRFRVLERIGAGGMGVVYAVYDEQLDRKLAVKLLLGARSGDPEGHARLLREAKTLARLSHPNVVQVHDVGEWQGRVFLAMEFVRGQTLRRWLATHEPSVRAIAQVFARAGAGLAAAHRVGIVHRDFKPDNVIVGSDGDVKVVDFGVARALDEVACSGGEVSEVAVFAARLERALTQTGQLVGTPAYMAPEQLTGDSSDARADQFAFAVTLFEALYGRRPFVADDLASLAEAVATRRVVMPRVPRVPRRIRDALLRALAPAPEDRFPSMHKLLTALQPPVRRHAVTALAGVVGLGLGGAALGQVYEARETQIRERAVEAATARDVEAERATKAELALRHREDAVSLAEARKLVERDPTRALATLLNVSEAGWDAPARRVAAEAFMRGVARQVDRVPVQTYPVYLPGERPEYTAPSASNVSEFGDVRAICSGTSHRLEVSREGAESSVVLDEGCASEHMMALLVSPHGDAVAVYREAAFEVYTVEGGERRTLAVPAGLTGSMALAPGGDAIALVGDDDRLWVYDVDSGRMRRFTGSVMGQVAFSPDGESVAAIRTDGGLSLWTRGGRALLEVEGPMTTARYAPDGRAIAAWRSGEDRVRVWSLPAGVEMELGAGEHTSSRAVLKWSPDARSIAAAVEGRVVVWELQTGLAWSPGIEGEVSAEIAFVDGGRSLVTLGSPSGGTRDQERRVFDLPFLRRTLVGHEGAVMVLAAGDHDTLWSGGADGTVRRWDLARDVSEVVLVHPMGVSTLAVGASGRVASSDGSDLRTWHPDHEERHIDARRVQRVAVDDARDLVLWLDDAGRMFGYDPAGDVVIPAAELCRGCDRRMDAGQGFSRTHDGRWRTIDADGAQLLWALGGRIELVASPSEPASARYGRVSLDHDGFSARDVFTPFDAGEAYDEVEKRVFSPRFSSDGTAVYTTLDHVVRWDPRSDEHWPVVGCIQGFCRDAVVIDERGTLAIAHDQGFIWIVHDESPREPLGTRTRVEQATNLRIEPLGDR